MPQMFKRNEVVLMLVIAALLFVGSGCGHPKKDLEFTVTFKDAKGLEPGQFLTYKGIRIGEVKDVALDPSMRIKTNVRVSHEYRTAVYREARFNIEKSGGVTDLSGEKQITMEDQEGPRTAIQPGDVIEGSEGWWNEVWEAAKRLGTKVEEFVKGLSDSPRAQEFLDSLQAYSRDVGRATEEQYRTFKEKRLPALKEKAEGLRDELEHSGKAEQAREFWRRFTDWVKDLDAGHDEPATE